LPRQAGQEVVVPRVAEGILLERRTNSCWPGGRQGPAWRGCRRAGPTRWSDWSCRPSWRRTRGDHRDRGQKGEQSGSTAVGVLPRSRVRRTATAAAGRSADVEKPGSDLDGRGRPAAIESPSSPTGGAGVRRVVEGWKGVEGEVGSPCRVAAESSSAPSPSPPKRREDPCDPPVAAPGRRRRAGPRPGSGGRRSAPDRRPGPARGAQPRPGAGPGPRSLVARAPGGLPARVPTGRDAAPRLRQRI